MKKIKYLIVLLGGFIFLSGNVNAACSDTGLINEAKKIEYKYDTHPNNVLVWKIDYTNITQKLYVKIHSTYDDSNEEYHYKDLTNGVLVYATTDTDKKATYTVNVYSDDAVCKDELLHTITFTTPILNTFYGLEQCIQYPNFSLCKKEVDEIIKTEIFYTELEKYKVSPPKATLDNPYYDRKECKDIREYELCQKKVSSEVSEERFEKLVKLYKTYFKEEEDSTKKIILYIVSGISIIATAGVAIFFVRRAGKRGSRK